MPALLQPLEPSLHAAASRIVGSRGKTGGFEPIHEIREML